MGQIEFEPWEPEETVGKIWHGLASSLDAPDRYPEAAVQLADLTGRLGVFFRALGGHNSVEIRPVADEISRHRLSLRRRLGAETERLPRASFDGEILRLPAQLDLLPMAEANAAVYLWLTAMVAFAGPAIDEKNPLRADLEYLRSIQKTTKLLEEQCPGLTRLRLELAQAVVATRPAMNLPPNEAAMEELAMSVLTGAAPVSSRGKKLAKAMALDQFPVELDAPGGYRRFRPVFIWPDLRPLEFSEKNEVESRDTDGPPEEGKEGSTHRAKRRKSDQAERRDSLILHKFEAILSWAEFLNLNRRVDDDDNDDAKKAADDQDEIGLGQISKAPATRLKLHLDLAPEDVDREATSGRFTYPEWDTRTGQYLQDHVCVLQSDAEPSVEAKPFDAATKRRIQAVRRQFEALRPGRVMIPGQSDGEDLDMEAAVRAQVDLVATGQSNDRIWRQSRPIARDLAVSILLDTSRSTESAVAGRSVIDIEREALTALAWGLEACGDDFAINAFSSLKRDRVFMTRCKGFDTRMEEAVEARIAALTPGFYTRLGAAIRHASVDLAAQTRKRRLLLVLTDGKPNDLDHYEGRHGIEDTRMAIREARRAGHAVYGITIDAKAKAWFSRMFGNGGFSLVANPEHLTHALPQIYRQLVGA